MTVFHRGHLRFLLAVAASVSPLWPLRAGPGVEVTHVRCEHGRCDVVLDTSRAGDQYYLIAASLSRDLGPFRVDVHTRPTDAPARVPADAESPDPAWERQLRDWHARAAAAREAQPPADDGPCRPPPAEREFYLFVGRNDFQNPAGYARVVGDLRGVGPGCQVYVDRDDLGRPGLTAAADDVVATFGRDILPRARRDLGRSLDVDRDGRFTVLMSGRLSRLSGGQVSLSGFVRGSDFYRDLPAPFGNRCDMMYLNSDVTPGGYLHTLLAHEYTHAVVFTEHVFGNYLPEVPRQDEESWLNEGLAHLVENRFGYSWANLDYRVSAYLSDPGRSPLVVADSYGAGLWRHHGHRGAIFLFLRWCEERFGPEFLTDLIRTNLAGVKNLEAATQTRFPSLFQDWAADTVLDGLRDAEPPGHLGLWQSLGGRSLCGPRFETVSLAGADHTLTLHGTAFVPLALASPAGPRTALTVRAEPGADLRVTLIRLPAGAARLTLSADPVAAGGVVLRLAADNRPVTIESAAWERLTPADNRPEDASDQSAAGGERLARRWFGDARLRAGETRTSPVIAAPVPGRHPWVVKVKAVDEDGHHLAGWAVVRP